MNMLCISAAIGAYTPRLRKSNRRTGTGAGGTFKRGVERPRLHRQRPGLVGSGRRAIDDPKAHAE
jgi:hypothetical protein